MWPYTSRCVCASTRFTPSVRSCALVVAARACPKCHAAARLHPRPSAAPVQAVRAASLAPAPPRSPPGRCWCPACVAVRYSYWARCRGGTACRDVRCTSAHLTVCMSTGLRASSLGMSPLGCSDLTARTLPPYPISHPGLGSEPSPSPSRDASVGAARGNSSSKSASLMHCSFVREHSPRRLTRPRPGSSNNPAVRHSYDPETDRHLHSTGHAHAAQLAAGDTEGWPSRGRRGAPDGGSDGLNTDCWPPREKPRKEPAGPCQRYARGLISTATAPVAGAAGGAGSDHHRVQDDGRASDVRRRRFLGGTSHGPRTGVVATLDCEARAGRTAP